MATPAPHSAEAGRPRAEERRLIVLGSTGSIGTQALEVVDHLNALADRGLSPVRYRVVGLAAGRNVGVLGEQALRYPEALLAVAHPDSAQGAGASLPGRLAGARRGIDGAERLVREVECDLVLAAMVGSAGLPATLAAVGLGRDVALANKETLVAAGGLVVPAARASGSRLLPVDSEHCAVWQALQCGRTPCPPLTCDGEIARVVLTASGGPFRRSSAHETYHATPREALNHPTWQMGPKVTIDSASLTNKALEIVEAHWLFGIPGEKIGVMIHPQSIVHAMVEFADGNVIAQLAPPDMRTPIQYALTFPWRPPGVSRKLDWRALGTLEFTPPDHDQFPALGAAYEVIDRGGTSGAVFNAANEAAVEAFLAGAPAIPFGRISELSLGALREVGVSPLRTLQDALDADREARRFVARALGGAVLTR